jgi:hypothetical protein
LSPDAKLSLESEASNPAKPRIERLKIPAFYRYGYRIFDAGQFLKAQDSDNSLVATRARMRSVTLSGSADTKESRRFRGGSPCNLGEAGNECWVNREGQMEALDMLALIILASIPERLETPILIMINRKKVFTVLGLMFIRCAISLLERPRNNNSAACCSRRREKLNCWAIRGRKSNPEGLRSSRSSRAG